MHGSRASRRPASVPPGTLRGRLARAGSSAAGALLLAALLGGVACGGGARTAPAVAEPSAGLGDAASQLERLRAAEAALAETRYAAAETGLLPLAASSDGALGARASERLVELLLATGRYQEAHARALALLERLAERDAGRAPGAPPAAAPGRDALDVSTRNVSLAAARAEVALGRVEEARQRLSPLVRGGGPAGDVELEVAELLLQRGRRAEAEPLLQRFIADYNEDRVGPSDGPALARVGRAAALLRAPEDANDALSEAERAFRKAEKERAAAAPDDALGVFEERRARREALLWHAELFLEHHNPEEAAAVLAEVAAAAPSDARGLALSARLRLEAASDFVSAERLANEALGSNPRSAEATAVLVGVALREGDFASAADRARAALSARPEHLELLSHLAAAEWLAEDKPGYEATRARVFALNPGYGRFYEVVAENLEWAHRYEEIVELLTAGVTVDPENGPLHGALGLNLLRGAREDEGVRELQRAFALDPFDQRVFNTLLLHEKRLPRETVELAQGPLRFRFPKADAAVLSATVPRFTSELLAGYEASHHVAPRGPLVLDILPDRPSFAVRVSGHPESALHGVCFGQSLATLSPSVESFAFGMTLAHELAHVFHIQLSRGRVPRWFAEGLAEQETASARPEWRRENDASLFALQRAGKLPPLRDLERVFTRAESVRELQRAYAATGALVGMLAETHGHDALVTMLRLWGEGLSDEEVFARGLGASSAELDERFAAHLRARTARFEAQYVPPLVPSLRSAKSVADATPGEPSVELALGLAALDAGELPLARAALDRARGAGASELDLLWADAAFAAASKEPAAARVLLERLVSLKDGYAPRVELMQLAVEAGDAAAAREHALRARALDPRSAEPLYELARGARLRGDDADELAQLGALLALRSDEPEVAMRFLELATEKRQVELIVRHGPAALDSTLASGRAHELYGRALLAGGQRALGLAELEVALLASQAPVDGAAVHALLAAEYARSGDSARAAAHRRAAAAAAARPPP